MEIDLIERKSPETINTKLELLVFSGEEGAGAMVNEGRRVEQPSSWRHSLSFLLLLDFWLCLWHTDVSRAGVEPSPQQQPEPQLRQCQILNLLTARTL